MMTEVIVPCVPNSKINIHPKGTSTASGWCDLHLHDECEISKLYNGVYIWTVNDKEIHLEEGDIIFVNSRVPHQTWGEVGKTSFLVHADIDMAVGRTENLHRRLMLHLEQDYAVIKAGTEANDIITECFENINRENTQRRKNFDMFIRSEVLKVFSVLYRENILKDPSELFDKRSMSRLWPVIEHIDSHFGENITLEEMSKMLCIDKTHFCRIFKKTVGVPFVNYLNLVRVLNAEKLLLTTEKSVVEIATETGFSSPTYFAEVFKQNMHYSPVKYRKIKLQN